MKEKPIIFQGWGVKAILDGRKTHMRRVIKPQPEGKPPYMVTNQGDGIFLYHGPAIVGQIKKIKCPYGVPGDQLWVRETWFPYTGHGCFAKGIKVTEGRCNIGYKADMKDDFEATYRSSIHMPRWASRINLEVVSIRVERLQDITEEDAIAEGAIEMEIIHNKPNRHGVPINTWSMVSPHPQDHNLCLGTARMAFANYFNRINDTGSWEANPWVWAIEFNEEKRC